MSRAALLDVNVPVAFFDPDHVHHEAAHGRFAENRESGWATCPLTENGVVRILANPAKPSRADPRLTRHQGLLVSFLAASAVGAGCRGSSDNSVSSSVRAIRRCPSGFGWLSRGLNMRSSSPRRPRSL